MIAHEHKGPPEIPQGPNRITEDLRDTADDSYDDNSHDTTIQWYAAPAALVNLETSPYIIIAAG